MYKEAVGIFISAIEETKSAIVVIEILRYSGMSRFCAQVFKQSFTRKSWRIIGLLIADFRTKVKEYTSKPLTETTSDCLFAPPPVQMLLIISNAQKKRGALRTILYGKFTKKEICTSVEMFNFRVNNRAFWQIQCLCRIIQRSWHNSCLKLSMEFTLLPRYYFYIGRMLFK